MNQHTKTGRRTLLASVLLSAPGPIVVGIGLFLGQSSTQLADFIRRTAELAAIVVSYAVYTLLRKDGEPDAARREKWERIANLCVGYAMTFSGLTMIAVSLFSSSADKGNVIPGLVIAALGVVANSYFWLRYGALNRAKPDAIIAVQARLYRAKALVDISVVAALTVVAAAPGTQAAQYVDQAGSLIVALYLIVSGIQTIRGGGGREGAPANREHSGGC